MCSCRGTSSRSRRTASWPAAQRGQRPGGGAAAEQCRPRKPSRVRQSRAHRAVQDGPPNWVAGHRQQGGAAGERLRRTAERLPRGADRDPGQSGGQQQQAPEANAPPVAPATVAARRHQQDRTDAQQDLRRTRAEGQGGHRVGRRGGHRGVVLHARHPLPVPGRCRDEPRVAGSSPRPRPRGVRSRMPRGGPTRARRPR